MFMGSLDSLPLLRKGRSRTINWENRTGEKGKGGMAASDLGPSRKGSPCIPCLEPGETVTLAEMDGFNHTLSPWRTLLFSFLYTALCIFRGRARSAW